MNITVEITGLKGVEDALAQAGPKLAKRAMRKALKAGAAKFVADAKARAPILKTPTKNRRAGDLRDAITSVIKLSPKQESGRARVGPKYTGKGADDPGVYGLFQEFGTKDSPAKVVEQRGLRVVSDEGALRALCERIVAANPKQTADYRAGKKTLLGFFVGQAMKETRGSANPKLVSDLMQKALDGAS